MSDIGNVHLPESPGDKRPISIQRGPRTTYIKVYQDGDKCYAYANKDAYQVPLVVGNRLSLLPQGAVWLHSEAMVVADRVHMAFPYPVLADVIRHFLLDGLIVRETLRFNKVWGVFCEVVDLAGPDVDPSVEGASWHKAFCEQWLAILDELEACS